MHGKALRRAAKALAFWDTFRLEAEGLHWSARGESRRVRTSRLEATQNKAALLVQWTIRTISFSKYADKKPWAVGRHWSSR